jgi:dissimilatory sulfite reductase (desulfoviridin) alpha/beta subunit
MPSDNKLELVVEVDVNKANASIKSVNTGLSSMEQAAGKAARGASAGIDGLTVSMVKGSAAGNLLADSIKKALDWAKEWTIGAAEHAAHTNQMSTSMTALAKALGVSAEARDRLETEVTRTGRRS